MGIISLIKELASWRPFKEKEMSQKEFSEMISGHTFDMDDANITVTNGRSPTQE